MKGKKSIFVFLLILALNITPVFGAWTVKEIQETESDQWRSESGNVWDNVDTLVLKDPNTQIRVALRFRGMNIDRNTRINGANLSFYSITTAYPFQANSSVTIYGFDVDDLRPFDAVEPWNLPITDAFVIWNTSNVILDQRYNVSVANIIQEIVSRYGYTSASKMGFMIYSTTGEQRVVYASEFGNNRGPILYIQYGEEPPTPSSQADPPYNNTDFYNWTYWRDYRGFDIWNVTGSAWVNYTTFNKIGAQPGKVTVVNSTYVDSAVNWEPDDDVRLEKAFNGTTNLNVVFGVTFHTFFDTSPVAERYWLVLYGLKQNAGPQFDFIGHQICLAMWSDIGTHAIRYQVYAFDGGGFVDFLPGIITTFPTTHWIEFSYDGATKAYSTRIYTDKERTQLWSSDQAVGGWGPLALNFQYGMNFYDIGYNPHDEGHWSLYGNAEGDDRVFIHAPTCNLTDPGGYDPDEDPDKIIDDILGPDPDDPEPGEWSAIGGLDRFRVKMIMFILGLIMLMGAPLFGFAMKPSASTWIGIFFSMICGWGLLIAMQNT